jgi:NADP-dependent 3-hydroxy acid dehydrogenase YdfG
MLMRDEAMDGVAGSAGIVTGAGRGIGEGCATLLAARGARVMLADLDEGRLQEVAAGIQEAGGQVAIKVTDVRDWMSVEALAAACVDRFGGIDFAIANAGIGSYSSIHDGDPDAWRRVVETNLLGVMHTVRATYPYMKDQRRGHIVLMASIAGRQTWVGEPIYIATKWGVVGFGWALRKEAMAHNVRVTMIEPGIVDTPLVRESEEGRSELDRFASLSTADVANAVAFALSQPEGVAVSELMLTPVGPEL